MTRVAAMLLRGRFLDSYLNWLLSGATPDIAVSTSRLQIGVVFLRVALNRDSCGLEPLRGAVVPLTTIGPVGTR